MACSLEGDVMKTTSINSSHAKKLSIKSYLTHFVEWIIYYETYDVIYIKFCNKGFRLRG